MTASHTRRTPHHDHHPAREDGTEVVFTEWFDAPREQGEPSWPLLWEHLSGDLALGEMDLRQFEQEYGPMPSAADLIDVHRTFVEAAVRFRAWLAEHPDDRARADLALVVRD